jgi:hypothetical protein
MLFLCGSMEYMFWSGSCNSTYWPSHGQHNSSISPYGPTVLPPLARLRHYMFGLYKGSMVGVEAWAGCMSSHTQLVCISATLVIA